MVQAGRVVSDGRVCETQLGQWLTCRRGKIKKATPGACWESTRSSVQERTRVGGILHPDGSGSCASLISSCIYCMHTEADSELWVSTQIPKTQSLPSGLSRNGAQECLISEMTVQLADLCIILKLLLRIHTMVFWMEVALLP